MKIPIEFTKKIIDFLQDLPLVNESNGRRGLLQEATLDQELFNLISIEEPPLLFFQNLIPVLIKYGRLRDERYALEAILQAAKSRIGVEKKEYCDILLSEWHRFLQEEDFIRRSSETKEINIRSLTHTSESLTTIPNNQDIYNETLNNCQLQKHSQQFANRQRVKEAKTLDWMAISLYKTFPILRSELTYCLQHGGHIRLLLVDPQSTIPHNLAQMGYSLGNADRIKENIKSTESQVIEWKKMIPACKVEIRYLGNQPPYRMVITNRLLPTADLDLRVFVFPNSEEMPIFSIKAQENKIWFEFFVDQFERFWNVSKPAQ